MRWSTNQNELKDNYDIQRVTEKNEYLQLEREVWRVKHQGRQWVMQNSLKKNNKILKS